MAEKDPAGAKAPRAPPALLPLNRQRPKVPAVVDGGFVDDEPVKIPTKLCSCQQNCTDRVTPELIKRVCAYFKGIPERNQQYKYLASLIQCRGRANGEVKPAVPGKRLRQAGYRYFVPMITERDLKGQEKTRREVLEMWNARLIDDRGSGLDDAFKSDRWTKLQTERAEAVVDPEWDHVEVCLKAFVTVHLMSEKRVIITRQTRKLQKYIKCSAPMPSHALEQEMKRKCRWDDEESAETEEEKEPNLDTVLRDVRSWMEEQARQAQKFAYPVNPKTLLPVGLVLPSSVTCMPVFPKGPPPKPYPPQDRDRDVDIVSEFFAHQLWKPEYIGGAP